MTWWRRECSGRRWPSGRRCRRFWWRCSGSFAPLVCLQILYCTILARKAAGCMIFINHSWVSFYRRLHLLMPRKLNSLLLLFSDFGARFLNQLLHFLHCGARTPSFGLLAISKARCRLDCSISNRPPCLSTVADMLKAYKKLIAASKRKIRLLPQLYTTL